MTVRIITGDAQTELAKLPAESVHCCVTSPPYYGLRDYGVAGQLGLEATPDEYVAAMVGVFREVRRVLRSDGVLWLNIGDSYASGGRKSRDPGQSKIHPAFEGDAYSDGLRPTDAPGIKPKDLLGIPWLLAFALRADGWWLRQDIIWCLSGGAWVYARTQKGDMPVMVKDLVRLDPRTVKLWNGEKWTQALGWGPTPDATERLELVLRSGERIGCTGGHIWPTQRGEIAARDLRAGDTLATCRLPEPDEKVWPQYLTEGALWLAGLYLAEGSKGANTLQISLAADELPWFDRIKAIAEHYGGSASYTLNGGSLNVLVWGRVIRAIIDNYVGGKVAIDKHLKVNAWRLRDEALRHLLQGYLDGDGHHDEPNGRYRLGFCRNYALERDLRTAAARLGATITLKPGIAAYQHGEQPNFRGEWRWERSGHWNEKDRGEITEIRASRARQFWDIGVEDEPHLFALASGVLTHNSKPNPMPESVTDRCTKAHEYLFLLSKSERYYFDADAIAEDAAYPNGANAPDKIKSPYGQGFTRSARDNFRRDDSKRAEVFPGQSVGAQRLPDGSDANGGRNFRGHLPGNKSHKGTTAYLGGAIEHRTKEGLVKYSTKVNADPSLMLRRNKRSVWTIATAPYSEAHFATFPPALVEPCILAGCPAGGTVLDPFLGAGTTALGADRLGRNATGIELNPAYAEMAMRRIERDAGLFAEVS